MRGSAAPGREDPARGVETGDVVGLGERAHQDHVLAVGGAPDSLPGAEDDRSLGRAGRRRDPGGQRLDLLGRVEDRVQQRLQRLGVDRQQRLLAGQQTLRDGVDGESHRRLRRPLRGAGLKQVEPALLDRELDVLHVLVVGLEPAEVVEQLGVSLGEALGQPGEVLGVAGTRDDVLALGVGEEVAGRGRLAGPLVAAEGDARSRSCRRGCRRPSAGR